MLLRKRWFDHAHRSYKQLKHQHPHFLDGHHQTIFDPPLTHSSSRKFSGSNGFPHFQSTIAPHNFYFGPQRSSFAQWLKGGWTCFDRWLTWMIKLHDLTRQLYEQAIIAASLIVGPSAQRCWHTRWRSKLTGFSNYFRKVRGQRLISNYASAISFEKHLWDCYASWITLSQNDHERLRKRLRGTVQELHSLSSTRPVNQNSYRSPCLCYGSRKGCKHCQGASYLRRIYKCFERSIAILETLDKNKLEERAKEVAIAFMALRVLDMMEVKSDYIEQEVLTNFI